MIRMQWIRCFAGTLLVASARALLSGVSRAQQAAEGAGEQPVAAAAKERAKPRGRLPAHFADVVTAEQREEVYAIQGKFNDQIAELEAQIASLRTQRDMEVENVLTPEQKERVAQLREDAKKRRAERSTKQSPAPSDEAGGT